MSQRLKKNVSQPRIGHDFYSNVLSWMSLSQVPPTAVRFPPQVSQSKERCWFCFSSFDASTLVSELCNMKASLLYLKHICQVDQGFTWLGQLKLAGFVDLSLWVRQKNSAAPDTCNFQRRNHHEVLITLTETDSENVRLHSHWNYGLYSTTYISLR